MLNVKKVSKNYGSLLVLSDASFSLGNGDKVALVGYNGVGKTTLLKIIAGIEDVDSGVIELQSGSCVGYLQQDTGAIDDQPIIDYLKKISGIGLIERKLEELSLHLDNPTTLKEYTEAHNAFERMEGYSFSHRAKIILNGLGFEEVDFNRSVLLLSSGQKVKVTLAGILLKGVDLLLLDEPTNNLDLPSIVWLENFLKSSSATAIIVSHDSEFLDKVATKVVEVDVNTKKTTITGGKYSDYISMSKKKLERSLDAYRLQQGEIKRLSVEAHKKKMEAQQGSRWRGSDNDKHIRGFKRERSGNAGKQASAIESRIERMDKIESPIERDPLDLVIEAIDNPGVLSISMQDVIAGYHDGFSIGPISFDILYGDRVGIVGLNGSGKSTILKTLIGSIAPLEGKVSIGSGIRFGDMMQEHQTLPRHLSPYELFKNRAGLSLQDSYAKMAKFGFEAEQTKKPIEQLSPGGRARLTLALFSVLGVNAMILDEPTNHLDIEAAQALEEALCSYDGTIILVSHDRRFLEKIKFDSVYLVADETFSRLNGHEEYIVLAEKRALKLINAL